MPLPAADELEVSLFGPGLGESMAIHVGGGRWCVVDSCVEFESAEPASLAYLKSIGVNPEADVVLVVATHWHDDHVRGLAQIFRTCAAAEFVCSGALCMDEFFSLLAAAPKIAKVTAAGSGLDEMCAVLAILKERRKQPMWAHQDQRLLQSGNSEVWALSPSSKTATRAFLGLAKGMITSAAPKRVFPVLEANESSVALFVRIGPAIAVLGADLETGTAGNGWHAVVASTNRPQDRAGIFKVAHHGSKNAHLDSVWAQMLQVPPAAILTPFVQGKVSLPTDEDVARISERSPRLFQSAPAIRNKSKRSDSSVEKTIDRVTKGTLVSRRGKMGQIRVRLGRNQTEAAVELFGAAFKCP